MTLFFFRQLTSFSGLFSTIVVTEQIFLMFFPPELTFKANFFSEKTKLTVANNNNFDCRKFYNSRHFSGFPRQIFSQLNLDLLNYIFLVPSAYYNDDK